MGAILLCPRDSGTPLNWMVGQLRFQHTVRIAFQRFAFNIVESNM